MTNIVIIGFGFMGVTHASVYRMLPNARVVGIVDPRIEEVTASLAERGWNIPVFPNYASAAADCDFSVADICLPTDLHRDIALEAFTDGRHVFCEKPIALTLDSANEITEAAREAGRQLMIGHCIRFWPEYVELKRVVDSREHGRLLSLSMSRRTARPGYSVGDWVNQPERCLGAALDLHIHDTDFLTYLLGVPDSVVSRGIRDGTGWSSIATQYHFGDAIVTADGAWNYPQHWGLQMRFSAVFERAAMDFDSRSNPTLTVTADDKPTVPANLPKSAVWSAAYSDEIASLSGYYHELDYFVDCIEFGNPVAVSTGQQAVVSLRVVLAEIESAVSGKQIDINQ